jgi:peptidoglycan/LPS O-acetylase OafA/YrhL
MNPSLPGRNLASLTSLRFFAAMLVVLHHVAAAVPPFAGYERGTAIGYVGVSFFFVLSGFVLAWTYKPGDRPGAFYGRRFARIWPMHMLMTIVVAVIMLFEGVKQNLMGLTTSTLLLQAWVPLPEIFFGYNGPSWSLSAEAFFYLLFPLIIGPALRASRPGRWIGGLILAMATIVISLVTVGTSISASLGIPDGAVTYLLYIFPPYRLLEFAIGVLLCALIRRGWRSPVRVTPVIWVTVIAYVLITVAANLFWDRPQDMPIGLADLLMLPAFILLIAASASGDLAGHRSALQGTMLTRLGKASFALYLVHQPVLELVGRYVPSGEEPVKTLGAIAAVGLSLVLAEVAHRWFENPVERVLRAKIGGRTRPPLPVSS